MPSWHKLGPDACAEMSWQLPIEQLSTALFLGHLSIMTDHMSDASVRGECSWECRHGTN